MLAFILVCSGLSPYPLNPTLLVKAVVKSVFISDKLTLSCGLLGPDNDGYTVDKSNSINSPEYIGSFVEPSYYTNNPYSFKYDSIVLTFCSSLFVSLR